MKIPKIAINGLLFLVVVALTIYLVRIIQIPIQFEKEYKVRKDEVIERLKDIREAQKKYQLENGKYAKNFDQLISALQNDSVTYIQTIGDPYDTTVVTTYDTLRLPMITQIDFLDESLANDPEQLRYIPFTDKAEFEMDAGEVERQRVTIPVFEVIADKDKYLAGLNEELVKNQENLKVGSMTEGSDAGNWE